MLTIAPFERLTGLMFRTELIVALGTIVAVIVERAVFAYWSAWRERTELRYRTLVSRALAGDDAATRALFDSPARHRLVLAALLILPLIEDRDPERISATELTNPDFAALARSYGGWAETVETTEQFAPALTRALEQKGVALLHLKTDIERLTPGITVSGLRAAK